MFNLEFDIISLFMIFSSVFGNLIVLGFVVFIAIRIAKSQKRRKEQDEIQDFASYQNYLYPPTRFPCFIYVSKDGYKSAAILLFIVVTIFNLGILLTHDKSYIPILAVIDIFFLSIVIYCLYCYKYKEMPCLQLMSDGIIFENTTIMYNEIESIFHTSEVRRRGKKRYVNHYFEIKGANQVLRLRIIDFLPEEWAEIINCCLYMNLSIKIDKVVMEILINKKKYPILAA